MRNFSAVPVKPYIGQIYQSPTKTFNTKFDRQKPLPPTVLPLQFNWLVYGASTANPNVGATIEIPTSGPRQLIDRILSVRIDNLGNAVPVYVLFPDTGYTVVAQPNSIVWEDVQTGGFNFFVLGEGFTTGQIGSTAVYICNFESKNFVDIELEQSVALWKASATISRGGTIYNQNFGTPAVGDQFIQIPVTVNNNGQLANVFPILSAGFYYITSLVVTGTMSMANAGVNGTTQVFFESTGSAGLFMFLQTYLPGWPGGATFVQPTVSGFPIFESGPVQWKLDATQQYRLRVDATSIGGIQGGETWNFTFTSNPT